MKSKLVALSLVFFTIAFTQFYFAQDKKQYKKQLDSPDSVVKKLELQKELIDSQQKRISELEKMIEKLKEKKPFVTVPGTPDYPKPKNGVPFKFNGETYYMVPLNGSKTDEELFKSIVKK